MINGLEIFFSNHSAIQAISSFMIAMLTFFYVLYTRRILNQQKKEEVIRNRAYVSTVSVENAEFNPGKNKIHFKFNVKNSGSTPATQVKTSSFFIIKGEKKSLLILILMNYLHHLF